MAKKLHFLILVISNCSLKKIFENSKVIHQRKAKWKKNADLVRKKKKVKKGELKKQKQKKESRHKPNIVLGRVIVNEINSVIKEILKLISNETKSSYLLLTKDIPKMNPGKKYSKHKKKKKSYNINRLYRI